MELLFEDEALLAVSKPAGLAVHGGAGERGPTLIDRLHAERPGQELHLAHRLDKGTSGLLLLAKSRVDVQALQASWEQAKKSYLAVALGRIERPLRIDEALKDKHGRERSASTEARPLAPLEALLPACTLLAVSIQTGRTHQIRLHLAERGHPVLGDDQHGDFAANKAWARALRAAGAEKSRTLMLHSHRLSCVHPRTRRQLRLTAPIPPAWLTLLSRAGAPAALIEELAHTATPAGPPVDGTREVP